VTLSLNYLNNIVKIHPFSLDKENKNLLFSSILSELTKHHLENCPHYKAILSVLDFNYTNKYNPENIPPIPVRLFKQYDLMSVDNLEIIKTMTSSGTTGQSVSKIFLDRTTSTNQMMVLNKIVSSFTGKKRLPMLIFDTKSVLKDRNMFSARGAGILGFSMLGYDVTYALDENMQLDFEKIKLFCRKHKNEIVFIFGFTYIIWKYLYRELEKTGKNLTLENGIMIHGGGWKKLKEEAVDDQTFKFLLKSVSGIKRVFNYYGMVEQTGSIFMECENGYLHSSIFSDITVLKKDFTKCDFRQRGILQISSLLPYSYPGHILLTEDTGEIIGEDDCSCGRLGKYFKIHGRVLDAEIRGCSDTYEAI
jgi:phenylacetate-coenzyme A ligase PaaK-like adenylate-forming protein